jgi:prephenate dehydrogenase
VNVGIVGYGRFGRLWGNLLAPQHHIRATDILPQPEIELIGLPELCAASETIFLCVPINQVERVIHDIAPHLKPGTTVFDTCSVKVHPANVLGTQLGSRDDLTLIASHPMFGPDSAAKGVAGLPMV